MSTVTATAATMSAIQRSAPRRPAYNTYRTPPVSAIPIVML
jgi:hypothetical protein